MLEREEGREHNAYADPLTHGEPYTIGIGHTGPEVHLGLTWDDEQIDAAFDADVQKATQGCSNAFAWFDSLDDVRQAVLIAMCFQMGIRGLQSFSGTLSFIASGDYVMAAQHMRVSLWAHQTPARANRMADQMLTGAWQ